MRTVTNEDVEKYRGMVNMYLAKYCLKNWNEASLAESKQNVALGNTGMTMEDLRQHLNAEVVVALHNYDSNYRTEEGKSVLESTFVYRHLFYRVGQLLKRLTKKSQGYGIWMSDIQEVLKEHDYEKGC